MGLGDFIRVFSCEGSNAYVLLGLLFFATAGGLIGHFRQWESYVARFWFAMFSAAGVFVGGAAYLFVHGSCFAPAA